MRLRELRRRIGMTQQDLSRVVGYKEDTVSRWERGKCAIKSDDLIVLADFFDVSIDYLLGRRDIAW